MEDCCRFHNLFSVFFSLIDGGDECETHHYCWVTRKAKVARLEEETTKGHPKSIKERGPTPLGKQCSSTRKRSSTIIQKTIA